MSKALDYVSQPDALTCQSACIAQVLGLDGAANVWMVRRELESLGVPGDPGVMGRYLKPKVREYKYNGEASLADFDKALLDGYRLITHGFFTPSGHVVGIQGIAGNGKGYVVDDPWAEFDFGSGTYTGNQNGNNLVYSRQGIYAYCVKAWSYGEAIAAYKEGKAPSDAKGAYLHMIKN